MGLETYFIVAAPAEWEATKRACYGASVEIQNGGTGGSGTIFHIDHAKGVGYILTCKHLFGAGQRAGHVVKVRVPGQSARIDAKLIALSGKVDLASLEFVPVAGMDFAPLCQDPTKPPVIGEWLWQFGYPVGHRGQDGPHHRTGTLQNEGVNGYLRISSGLRSGDSGGGIFRTDGQLMGVGVWGSGGHVDLHECSVFVNQTCWPHLRNLLPRNWPVKPKEPGPAPSGPSPRPPDPPPIGLLPPAAPATPTPGLAGPPGPPGKDGRDGKDGKDADLTPLIAALEKINARLDKMQSPVVPAAVDYEKLAAEVIRRLPPSPAYFDLQPIKR